ncbi:Minor allergen Alt a 7 [Zancudomyces culisetae]|uniref:Minor allergen Alt a 7 n=1 Tax=Zancudomyces culisetae TaxID=1213189 RepID=A0A1R1PFH8_ZANCU|nr:Minor allergen Alt a 7 [Zancudomyces culisetae]|eukprot:OMH79706.1 Minor allergen Alt a 7 [Zancudomyces culisetae]
MMNNADGYIFGMHSRTGAAPACYRNFWDSIEKHKNELNLKGKMVGVFFSTENQASGQEAMAFSILPMLAYHELIYVPLGNPENLKQPGSADISCGGSSYGAGTIIGQENNKKPTQSELEVGKTQGLKFSEIVCKYLGNGNGNGKTKKSGQQSSNTDSSIMERIRENRKKDVEPASFMTVSKQNTLKVDTSISRINKTEKGNSQIYYKVHDRVPGIHPDLYDDSTGVSEKSGNSEDVPLKQIASDLLKNAKKLIRQDSDKSNAPKNNEVKEAEAEAKPETPVAEKVADAQKEEQKSQEVEAHQEQHAEKQESAQKDANGGETKKQDTNAQEVKELLQALQDSAPKSDLLEVKQMHLDEKFQSTADSEKYKTLGFKKIMKRISKIF